MHDDADRGADGIPVAHVDTATYDRAYARASEALHLGVAKYFGFDPGIPPPRAVPSTIVEVAALGDALLNMFEITLGQIGSAEAIADHLERRAAMVRAGVSSMAPYVERADGTDGVDRMPS